VGDCRELWAVSCGIIVQFEQGDGKEFHVLWDAKYLCGEISNPPKKKMVKGHVLLRGSWMKYSFLHSFGRVTCAGMNGYMKVSKLGRHHCASVSPTTHSSLTPSPVNCVPTGARRSFSLALKPSTSSSSARR
jgi:hypothetical protein